MGWFLSLSKTVDLLGFSQNTVSRVFIEWSLKKGGNALLIRERKEENAQIVFRAARQDTVTRIFTLKHGEQKS